MVGNSGLKEAEEAAKRESVKVRQTVLDSKSLLPDELGSLAEAKSKIEVIKKVPDKAHHQEKAFFSPESS